MSKKDTTTLVRIRRISVVVLLSVASLVSRPRDIYPLYLLDDSLTPDLFSIPYTPENFFFEETHRVTKDARPTPTQAPVLAPPTALASGTLVRIALAQNRRAIQLYAEQSILVRMSGQRIKIPRGEVRFSVTLGGILLQAHGKSRELFAPCTVLVDNNSSWEYENRSYEGMAVISTGVYSGLSMLNVLPVEAYLRGVVPLEIGGRSQVQLEALKAQAVAARTYTYKRIQEREARMYDLLPTVADQVYGGVGVANQFTDAAIRATVGEVMLYGGTLVSAYYHSTCGGYTASIEDVWNSPPIPYLRSIADVNSEGKVWCSHSAKFRWHESWSVEELSTILRTYTRGLKENLFQGTISEITVLDRSEGGRIRQCRVVSTMGTYYYGKDHIRQYFRRTDPANSIQWSSNFSIFREGSRYVAQGKGFGHGIGFCQFGALGRASGGQTYREILGAYYQGVQVTRIKS